MRRLPSARGCASKVTVSFSFGRALPGNAAMMRSCKDASAAFVGGFEGEVAAEKARGRQGRRKQNARRAANISADFENL